MFKNLFGHSTTGQTQGISQDHWDALGYYEQQKILQRVAQSNNQAAINMLKQVQYNQAAKIGGAMAGGGAYIGHGMANAQANAYSSPQTEAFLKGVKSAVKENTRQHIADEVQKMAEEIGAPTLLHAVVLAIRTMEIPE